MKRLKINDLPSDIRSIFAQRLKEQGKSIYNGMRIEGLYWNSTSEGYSVWQEVSRGFFDSFYLLYPQKGVDNYSII